MKTGWCDPKVIVAVAAIAVMVPVALGSTGCDRGAPPTATQKSAPEVKTDAKADATAKVGPNDEAKPTEPVPAGETKAEPATDTKPEPATDTKPEPATDTKPEPVEPATPSAGIDPPDKPRVLALARDKGLAKPALATTLTEAGPRRYLAAIRDRKGAEPVEYSLHLLLLRSPEPAAGAEPQWEADGVLELHRWSNEWEDDSESGSIPTTVIIDDHERDGELEALVRFRHTLMCPGGGPNEITELRMVELEPSLAVTLTTELHHEMVSVQTKGTAHHEDLDGDGHPDLRISYASTSEDEPKPHVQENRWRWLADEDAWVRDTAGATLPAYENLGCDY